VPGVRRACLVAAVIALVAAAPAAARDAYVTNQNDDDVSVIDTATNTKVGADIGVGVDPVGIAITPDGARAYVTNQNDADVSVIDTATNTKLGVAELAHAHPQHVAAVTEAVAGRQGGAAEALVSAVRLALRRSQLAVELATDRDAVQLRPHPVVAPRPHPERDRVRAVALGGDRGADDGLRRGRLCRRSQVQRRDHRDAASERPEQARGPIASVQSHPIPHRRRR